MKNVIKWEDPQTKELWALGWLGGNTFFKIGEYYDFQALPKQEQGETLLACMSVYAYHNLPVNEVTKH